MGIIEDTENGYQKYRECIHNNEVSIPIFSVARSEVKKAEDYLVGKDIVTKAEFYLHNATKTLFASKALVLGFGKIGTSIAEHLRRMGVAVTVIDTDPVRQILALAQGYEMRPLIDALNENNYVFSATGSGALGVQEIERVVNELVIFSATSGDDEFRDIEILRKNSNNVHIANSGNSINFITPSTYGKYIKLIQTEMIHIISKICNEKISFNNIQELDYKTRQSISNCWISFHSEDAVG